jgi:two-component system, LytTR family, sensor kinase
MRHWQSTAAMPESLDLREPLLVNAIGHSAGVLIFGLLLLVLLRDRRLWRAKRGWLAPMAALLAVVWNGGSLAALAGSVSGQWSATVPTGIGFAALSLLPAVLLAIALGSEAARIQFFGGLVSATAAAMHIGEGFGGEAFHRAALLVVTVGFVLLPALAAYSMRSQRRALSRVLVPMALVLFAISFVHFGDTHAVHPWTTELAIHHAGIPLALYIVLQEYRFLLLDVFLRALANAALAGVFTVGLVWADNEWRLREAAFGNPFYAGLAIVAACTVLVAFAWLRGYVQIWVTRGIFRRPSVDEAIQRLLGSQTSCSTEQDVIQHAARAVADYAGAVRFSIIQGDGSAWPDLANDAHRAEAGPWVDAVIPLQFARGDGKVIALGPRTGGRRYLSEDFRELSRLAGVIVAQVERFRVETIERLAAEAELRALQAQINPHFLFNALNALYAAIPRSAGGARSTVLNLADIFRYFLQNDRSAIALSEELKIIRAYLEVEQLRLGDRLRVEIDVDKSAALVQIPPLSIQPLVENAVKHGVARRTGPGHVVLRIRRGNGVLRVEVRDSGGAVLPSQGSHSGVGLDNVRQRLRLAYGPGSQVSIGVEGGETVVSFEIPDACPPVGISSPLAGRITPVTDDRTVSPPVS